MSFLTTKEISELLGIKLSTLKNFVQTDRRAMLYFHRQEVLIECPYMGDTIIKKRNVWGIDRIHLTDFSRFWKNKTANKRGRFAIYNNQQDRLAWTPTAIECYKRKSCCSPTCSSWEFCNNIYKLEQKKPIKEKVREIYAALGKPIERTIEE